MIIASAIKNKAEKGILNLFFISAFKMRSPATAYSIDFIK